MHAHIDNLIRYLIPFMTSYRQNEKGNNFEDHVDLTSDSLTKEKVPNLASSEISKGKSLRTRFFFHLR